MANTVGFVLYSLCVFSLGVVWGAWLCSRVPAQRDPHQDARGIGA